MLDVLGELTTGGDRARPQKQTGETMKPKFRLLFTLPEPAAVEMIAVAFDSPYALIATSSSLWRVDEAFSPSGTPQKMAVQKGEIQNLYRFHDGLYLLKRTVDDGSGNVLLRSTDQAASFTPIDAALTVNEAGFETKLNPTRMAASPNVKFINAGGGRNILTSDDDTRTWTLLYGMFANMTCYAGKFLVRDHVMIIGGECPLDTAYLMRGTLSSDFKTWREPLVSVAPAGLSNRNVQFIDYFEPWDMTLAGVEGGLLGSRDLGRSWEWLIREEVGGGGPYPYVQHGLPLAGSEDQAFAGGYDKGNNGRSYLALTCDRGKTWTDVSGSVQAIAKDPRQAMAVISHPDGRVIVAVQDFASATIVFAELAGFEA